AHAVARGPRSLCVVPEQRMRVCPADERRSSEVVVEDAFDGTISTMKVARGAPLSFYEYVAGEGETKAVVRIEGKARFILADEVCHLDAPPPASKATAAFEMKVSRSGPEAFRPRS